MLWRGSPKPVGAGHGGTPEADPSTVGEWLYQRGCAVWARRTAAGPDPQPPEPVRKRDRRRSSGPAPRAVPGRRTPPMDSQVPSTSSQASRAGLRGWMRPNPRPVGADGPVRTPPPVTGSGRHSSRCRSNSRTGDGRTVPGDRPIARSTVACASGAKSTKLPLSAPARNIRAATGIRYTDCSRPVPEPRDIPGLPCPKFPLKIMRFCISAAASVLATGFILSLVLAVGTPAPVSALDTTGCNEWAGYHEHSFGCHSHVDDPHPAAAEATMADTAMDSAASMAGSTGCNEWAGYHEHSFGCHSHVDNPHPADEAAMAAEAMTAAAPAHGLMGGCNEWAGYHWHSFGCHAHVDDPHPAEPAMAAEAMVSAAPMASSTGCNEWAGYHEHSFGCHSHVDDPPPGRRTRHGRRSHDRGCSGEWSHGMQ